MQRRGPSWLCRRGWRLTIVPHASVIELWSTSDTSALFVCPYFAHSAQSAPHATRHSRSWVRQRRWWRRKWNDEAVSTRTTVCVPRCRFVCYNSCMELWLTLFIWYQMNNVQHRKVILSQACYDLGNTTFQLLSHSQFVWITLTSVCITFLQISITVGDFSNARQFLAETLDLLLISKFSFCCLVGLVRICLQLEIRPKIWFNPSLKYLIWYWNVILQAFFLISRRPDLLLIENHLIFVHLFRFYDGPSS